MDNYNTEKTSLELYSQELVDSINNSPAPLYLCYPQQINPQPAYLSIDIGTQEVKWDYNGEIGATSIRHWNGIEIRIQVSPSASRSSLLDLSYDDRVLRLIERIDLGGEVVWDGSNHVGVLNDDAQDAEVELGRLLEREIEVIDVYGRESVEQLYYYCSEKNSHDQLAKSWDDVEKLKKILQESVDELVEEMIAAGVDGYIIPSALEHHLEGVIQDRIDELESE